MIGSLLAGTATARAETITLRAALTEDRFDAIFPVGSATLGGVGDVGSSDHPRCHVCFVCTGNICRSPIAEIVFADALRREGIAHLVRVSSAGTGDWHVGSPADPRTAETLRRAGYDCRHVATQLSAQHLAADLLVALDSGHLTALRRLVAEPERVVLLRSFDPAAKGNLDVPDPYLGDRRCFDAVLSMVRAAMPGLLTWVRGRL